ncbi:MAG: DUF2079 domain-containing protein [Acidimicrobiia bacterium]|nr:DUF2079 domain-containing protein [Acidimicrobiia bacterium]
MMMDRSFRLGWAGTVLLAFVWSVVFAVRGVFEQLRFHTHAFDLGIFTQGTYLLSQLKEPFVTVRGLHLFADHSSYILILIAPIYALAPSSGTLIVISVIALGVSAPIAFSIARRAGAGPLLSTLTGVLVLVAPAVQWHVRNPFHPEVLVIPLALAAISLLQRNRDGWAIAAIVLALTAKEDVGLLVVPLGLAVVFLMHKCRVGYIISAAGLIAFLLNFYVLLPAWSPTGDLLYSYRYSHLGDSPMGILVGLVTSPDVWFETITDPKKIWYVVALVFAMPLSVFASRWLLVGIPTLLANVLSLHGYQYEIKWQYTASLIVVVAIAGAFGAGRVERFQNRTLKIVSIGISLIVPIVIWIAAAPIRDWAKPHSDFDRINTMLAQIPSDDSVSAWTSFVPHVANREEIYLFPNPFLSYNYGADDTELPDPSTIEWVALRLDSLREFEWIVDDLIESGDYEVFYKDLPFVLLHRVDSRAFK